MSLHLRCNPACFGLRHPFDLDGKNCTAECHVQLYLLGFGMSAITLPWNRNLWIYNFIWLTCLYFGFFPSFYIDHHLFVCNTKPNQNFMHTHTQKVCWALLTSFVKCHCSSYYFYCNVQSKSSHKSCHKCKFVDLTLSAWVYNICSKTSLLVLFSIFYWFVMHLRAALTQMTWLLI